MRTVTARLGRALCLLCVCVLCRGACVRFDSRRRRRSFNDAGGDDDDDDDDATVDDATVDDDDATVDGGVFPTHSRRGSAWTPQRQRVCADSHRVFLFFIDCDSDRGGATPRGDGDPGGGFATRKRIDCGSGDG